MRNRRYMIISTAVVILLWLLIAVIVNNPVKLPSPIDTVVALVQIITGKNFIIQVLSSIRRIVVSFSIAFILALVLGIVAGISNTIYYLLKPLVLTQRAVPTMAVILLAIIWYSRESAPILVCGLVIFPIIYSSVVNGIRNVDENLLEMAAIYKMNRKRKIKHLYLPSLRSSLISVASATLSLNIKINIAAEVLSQPQYSIGTGFQLERVAINTAGIFAWSIVVIVLAGCAEWLISKLFSKWEH